jgi:hypothetical protein
MGGGLSGLLSRSVHPTNDPRPITPRTMLAVIPACRNPTVRVARDLGRLHDGGQVRLVGTTNMSITS